MRTNTYRDNGAIGALLDEYERALDEFYTLLDTIPNESLSVIVDKSTENPDCKSIQTILSHMVNAGYWYNIETRRALGEELDDPVLKVYDTGAEYKTALKAMFKSTEKIFTDYPDVDLYIKRNLRWKNIPSIDMLLEHAIVHILRHRRQTERFLIKMEA